MQSKSCRKRLCALAVAGCLSLSMMGALPASAASFSVPYTPTDFSSDWQRYATSSDGLVNLTYGFKTRLILLDQDYCYAYHSSKTHTAKMYNDDAWYTSSQADAQKRADLTLSHTSDRVWGYGCYW